MKTKEAYSIKGWKAIEWLKGNWKAVKELVKVGIPLLFSIAYIQNSPGLIAFLTVVGKLVMDTLEFYFSEVKLK